MIGFMCALDFKASVSLQPEQHAVTAVDHMLDIFSEAPSLLNDAGKIERKPPFYRQTNTINVR